MFPDELDESNRLNQVRTYILGVRVRDDLARELTMKFRGYADAVLKSKTRTDSEEASSCMADTLEALNQRVGELLRKLDDTEQV